MIFLFNLGEGEDFRAEVDCHSEVPLFALFVPVPAVDLVKNVVPLGVPCLCFFVT